MQYMLHPVVLLVYKPAICLYYIQTIHHWCVWYGGVMMQCVLYWRCWVYCQCNTYTTTFFPLRVQEAAHYTTTYIRLALSHTEWSFPACTAAEMVALPWRMSRVTVQKKWEAK